MRDTLRLWSRAARVIRRAPLFSVIVITVLGGGIAAAVTIAAVADSVFREPLPFRDPDSLVMLWSRRIDNPRMREMNVSGPALAEWATVRSIAGAAAFTFPRSMHVAGGAAASRLNVASVTFNALATLGVAPIAGRDFLPADMRAAERTVMISNAVWHEQFGARADAIGRSIRLDGEPAVIVGVLPSGFYLANLIVLRIDALVVLRADDPALLRRDARTLMAFGRLARSASSAVAQSELDVIAARQAAEHPDTDGGWGVFVQDVAHDARTYWAPSIGFVSAGVVSLLVIVISTVLLLALGRAVDRDREIAVRTALGASRGDIFRESTAEGLTLSLAAFAVGVLGAAWLIGLFRYLDVPYFPRLSELTLSPPAVAAGGLVALLVAPIFGVLVVARVRLHTSIGRMGRPTGDRRHQRIQTALVAAQIALTIVAAVAGIRLGGDLLRLSRLDMGFDRDNLFTVRVALPPAAHVDRASRAAFFDAMESTLARDLSPAHLTVDANAPGTGSATAFFSTGRETSASQKPWADVHVVDPMFFRVMKIPVTAGVGFDAGPPSERVVIVNRTLARRFFDGHAVGREITIAGSPSDDPGTTQVPAGRRRIVGVVGDTVDWPLATDVPNQIYVPLASDPPASAYLLVRHAGADALATIRRDAAAIDPDAAVYDAVTIDARLSKAIARQQLNTALAYGFAGFSLLLASVAVYGVMAYRIRRRARELAIRIALGASPRVIEGLILGDGGRIILFGTVAGGGAGLLVRPALNAVVFRAGSADGYIVALAAAFVALVGMVAAYVPALRAARSHELIALRGD